MLTQCPACHVWFRLRPEHIEAAQGLVRCGRCREVFNALDGLKVERDDDDPLNPKTILPEWSEAEPVMRPDDDAGVESPPRSDPLHWDADRRPADASAPADSRRQAAFDLDADAPSSGPAESPDSLDPDTLRAVLRAAPGHSPARHARPATRRPSTGLALWSVGAVIATVTLALQFMLADPAFVDRYPLSRLVLEPFCRIAPCSVPPRRDPALLAVISREVQQDPDRADALQVTLTVVNTADFAQPAPRVQLALMAAGGQVLARRVFEPGEYAVAAAMIEPAGRMPMRLDIIRPDARASGFQIDLL
ncbi:MAG: zinc-ribbon and DUF3426 domain-containing protein [Chromatiales bacterium]|nr:zinc-ribbon and DUF3426 domain-containing protein [Chromatiales bacterium]